MAGGPVSLLAWQVRQSSAWPGDLARRHRVGSIWYINGNRGAERERQATLIGASRAIGGAPATVARMVVFATRCWMVMDRVGVPLRWLAVLGCAALIFLLSAQPGLKISSDPGVDGPTRHLAHVAIYGVLTVLLGWALSGVRAPTIRIVLVSAVLALIYGATDEWHQTFVPARTGRAQDLVWDGLGAILGCLVLLLVVRGRRRTP
jgi:VanZ like family